MTWITAELETGTAVSLANGRHEWRGDEPEEKGGRDTGPSPYELLLGSLAACTLITLRLYCDHKGIALTGATARCTHEKADVTNGDGSRAQEDVIRSRVRIEGEFTGAQRKRLAQIVSRCPVHRTLDGAVRLEDEVEFA